MNHLHAMNIFVKVVESGAFNKAALQMGVPRSTVSKAVRELEVFLDTKLILRSTRSFSVTSEGMDYYHRIISVLDELETINSEMRGKKLEPAGELRIDSQVAFAYRCLIPSLPEFQKRYPKIKISLGISDKSINIIGESVDCVIRAGETGDIDMVAKKIMELDYVTCATPDLVKTLGNPESPEEMASRYPLISYFPVSSKSPNPLVFKLKNDEFTFEHASVYCNDGEGLIQLMLSGSGVGQHARKFVEPYLESGELITLLDDWNRDPIPLNIIYPSGRTQNMRVKVFVDWLMETFG